MNKTKMSFKISISLIAICFFLCSPTFSEVGKGKLGLGLNFPGINIRYFFSKKMSIELKGQMDRYSNILGLRGYYYFNSDKKYLLFSGIETDFISFDGELSMGEGFAAELFIGCEHFFAKKLSLQLDLGPAYISLSDNRSSRDVGSFEYVANIGINYYIGTKD